MCAIERTREGWFWTRIRGPPGNGFAHCRVAHFFFGDRVRVSDLVIEKFLALALATRSSFRRGENEHVCNRTHSRGVVLDAQSHCRVAHFFFGDRVRVSDLVIEKILALTLATRSIFRRGENEHVCNRTLSRRVVLDAHSWATRQWPSLIAG